ncbi:MAG: hemolysin family protein [Ruminococcus sp.]|nr:hemolysin family protein [Ruminococcus sp.]
MDGDGARSISLLLLIIIFIIFFLYSLAEASITELSSQRLRSFETAAGMKKRLWKLHKKTSKLLAVFLQIRILSTAFIFFYSVSVCSAMIDEKSPPLLVLASALLSAIMTIILQTVLFYGFPKRIARGISAENNESLALFMTPAVEVVSVIFTPTIVVSNLFVKLFALIFNLKIGETESEVTEEEILMMVDAGFDTGAIEESQAEMITNIFEFSDTPVSDIMTHRTEIVAVRAGSTPSEVAMKSAESGFSRLPVYMGTIDKITGIICVKDLLPLIADDKSFSDSFCAEEYLRPVIYLPETATAKNVFIKLRDKKMQMAVITDEYGGTAGIITMEDLLEEIVGSIQDEYDDETEEIKEISPGEYEIDGLSHPHDVLSKLGLVIPDEENEGIRDFDTYDTMSAFLLSLAGVLPDHTEDIEATYDNCKFSAMEISDMRITKIKAVFIPPVSENDNQEDIKSEKKEP